MITSLETLLRHGVRDLLAPLLDCPAIAGQLAPGKAGDAVVGVVTYDTGDVGTQIAAGITTISLQVTVRGSVGGGSDPVSDRRQVIRDALTFTTPRTINTVLVSFSVRQLNSGPPVTDSLGRPVAFDTYDLAASRPSLIPST